jgi:hypothetical protein
MALHGIADRLFGLGKAKARHASKGLPDLGDLLGRLEPGERKALERASKAAARTRKVLHGPGLTSPALLDEVGGEVDKLAALAHELAKRLGKARLWLRRHDPDRLGREAAEAELDEVLGAGSANHYRAGQEALRRQAAIAGEVQAGMPLLSLRLTTAARELEALEARVSAGAVSGLSGADGLLDGLRAQRDKAERALDDWAATVREMEGL